jgi:hypothetical protein
LFSVALSDLTLQNINYEITAAGINKSLPSAGIGLPKYHRYMVITEPEAFKGRDTILMKTTALGRRSVAFTIFLVRRKNSSDLAGCFLFGFDRSAESSQDAASSSSSNPEDSLPVRLLLQRVYPTTGANIKASDWYQCLYATLFQGFLYKGFALPVHLLSAALLPEIRKAPGSVRASHLYRCFLARGAGVQNLFGIAC